MGAFPKYEAYLSVVQDPVYDCVNDLQQLVDEVGFERVQYDGLRSAKSVQGSLEVSETVGRFNAKK
eukprot:8145113-Pyramimonas_sp.AAC.1